MTHPPAGPSTPPPPSGPKTADLLEEIDDLLVSALARATLLPEDSGQVILAFRLRMARRAVAELQTPARPRLDFAAAVVGGPVKPTRMLPGECLTPGYGAAPAVAVTESAGSVVAPVQAQAPAAQGRNRVGEPPLPGTGTFSVPPTPTVRPFPSRTEPFEFWTGRPLYDALLSHSRMYDDTGRSS